MKDSKFSKSDIHKIREAISVIDLAREYTSLTPSNDHFVCNCLFHQETQPSMHVHEDRFYCFGCKAQGDAFELVQKIEGVSFPESIKILAEKAGISIQGSLTDNDSSEQSRMPRGAYQAIYRNATEFFQSVLVAKEGEKALKYLNKRGVSTEMRDLFQIGASPDEWEALKGHLLSQKKSLKQCVEACVLREKNKRIFDCFRDRLMFPIHDAGGRVVGFGARTLGDDLSKYINTAESDYFKKSRLMYGLYQARKAITVSKQTLVTEGYLDVIALHQFGFNNAVGALGTAFTDEHVKLLMSFAEEIIFLFDGDSAGQAAAFKAVTKVLKFGLNCRAVLLPDGEDADSLLQSKGAHIMQKLIDDAPDGLSFCMEMLKTSSSPKRAIWWLKEYMATLKDPSLRAFYIPKISKALEISEHEFRQWEVCKSIEELPEEILMPAAQQAIISPAQKDESLLNVLTKDRHLLWGVIASPQYLKAFETKLPQLLQTAEAKIFFEKLCAGNPEHCLNLDEQMFFQECQQEADPRKLYSWYEKTQIALKSQ